MEHTLIESSTQEDFLSILDNGTKFKYINNINYDIIPTPKGEKLMDIFSSPLININ